MFYILSSKNIEGDKNSIIFDERGDHYYEQINIEISLTPKEDFVEIKAYSLYKQLNELKHIKNIIDSYFINIIKRIPNENDFDDKIYLKCYKILKFFDKEDVFEYADMSLDSLFYYIKRENHGIVPPILK